MVRPILLVVGKLVGVLRDLLGNRRKGAGLRFRIDHVLGRMERALEEIKVIAVAFDREFLDLHAELAGKLLQILVIGVDKLATEFAEHALVEVVMGEHASTPAIARLEHNRRRAGGL